MERPDGNAAKDAPPAQEFHRAARLGAATKVSHVSSNEKSGNATRLSGNDPEFISGRFVSKPYVPPADMTAGGVFVGSFMTTQEPARRIVSLHVKNSLS
ncbi:hypothetical protein MRX96_057009 [Rhipicephalus microplus]